MRHRWTRELVVHAAKRVNYCKKYIIITNKDYYPWLGWCLKTRKPSVGQWSAYHPHSWMAKQGKATIESPKFIVRVM